MSTYWSPILLQACYDLRTASTLQHQEVLHVDFAKVEYCCWEHEVCKNETISFKKRKEKRRSKNKNKEINIKTENTAKIKPCMFWKPDLILTIPVWNLTVLCWTDTYTYSIIWFISHKVHFKYTPDYMHSNLRFDEDTIHSGNSLIWTPLVCNQ